MGKPSSVVSLKHSVPLRVWVFPAQGRAAAARHVPPLGEVGQRGRRLQHQVHVLDGQGPRRDSAGQHAATLRQKLI